MTRKTTKQSTNSNQAGFSLIEVLVSLSLFAIVVTMSVGTMVVLIDANTKAQFTQSIVSNASFALDSMARDIRTGTNYVCSNNLQMGDNDASPSDCPSPGGGAAFAFTEAGGSLTNGLNSNRIGFRYNSNSHGGTGIGAIERKLSTNASEDWKPITADNVNITDFTFTVRHTDSTDNRSPLVTIEISGEGVSDFQNTQFSLRTTVTQRALDI